MVAVEVFENLRQQADVFLQADPLARLDEMLFAHLAELGIVQQQVSEFPALLDQVDAGEAGDTGGKVRNTEHFAEH